MSQLFSVSPSALNPVAIDPAVLPAGYSSITSLQLAGNKVLYAFNKTTKLTDVYVVIAEAPYLKIVVTGDSGLNLQAWEIVKSFTLGNKPYLLTYESTGGNLGFYEVNSDYSISQPYVFMNKRSWPTQGFTEVSAFVSLGLMYVLGYDGEKGTVAIFSLDVIASSATGLPPLNMLNVWYHQWAKGWTNFSFFQLGQSNFFFKINKAKLNVNIDHIQDNPALGSIEIGSFLQAKMPNANDVTMSSIIPWANGEPCLATYDDKAKNVTVYNIYADCQGWETLSTKNVDPAALMISFRMEDTSYLLLY